jgi:hypothetical protein
MRSIASKLILFATGLIYLTSASYNETENEKYYTPRRPIREVLNSDSSFTNAMIEELLMTSKNISKGRYAVPMNHLLFDDVERLMHELVSDFPEIISIETIGYSYQGRPIEMLTMTLRNES